MEKSLSTDLESLSSVPYFLWDEPMTVGELKHKLASASEPERLRLLGKIMREARDADVWMFTTPRDVWQSWPQLSRHLGRRRDFWKFLFDYWEREGLIG